MIAFVRAYSLSEACAVLQRGHIGLAGDLLEYPSRVAWIGFEPEGPSPVRAYCGALGSSLHKVVLRMQDIDSRKLPAGVYSTDPDVPSAEHAREVVSLLRRVHEDPREWAVAVHCTMGISRSGAVARHVFDTYKPTSLADWRFDHMHRRCIPNADFLRLLREAEEGYP